MSKKFILFKLFTDLNKRQKFVLSVIILSIGFFLSDFFGINGIIVNIILAILTDAILYLILKEDIKGTFFYPILILPFLYTLSVSFFNLLIPPRFISSVIITIFYMFGLYSLFLTQNIFAISSVRTINLLRSARIVSFILTIIILFFLINIIFSLRLPILIMPLITFMIVFILNFQSFWNYSLDKSILKEIIYYAAFSSLAIAQISLILTVWPVNANIYSIFITGMFYTYSGLSHTWFERRLFKGIMWEYIWVGFLSVLILIFFSNWGF